MVAERVVDEGSGLKAEPSFMKAEEGSTTGEPLEPPPPAALSEDVLVPPGCCTGREGEVLLLLRGCGCGAVGGRRWVGQ